jgi:hypothetical protein
MVFLRARETSQDISGMANAARATLLRGICALREAGDHHLQLQRITDHISLITDHSGIRAATLTAADAVLDGPSAVDYPLAWE